MYIDDIAFKKEMLQELIIDKFYNNVSDSSFEAIILSEPQKQSQLLNAGDSSGNPIDADNKKSQFFFLRVRPREIQEYILPNPFQQKDNKLRIKLINAHPLAAIDAKTAASQEALKWGQIWQCRFTSKGYRGIVLEKFLRTADITVVNATDNGSETLVPDVIWGESSLVGDYKPEPASFDREILEIEHSLPPLGSSRALGVGYPQVTAQAQTEMDWWKGKEETDNRGNDQSMKDKLQSYWDYANASWGREKGWPWSAVYISYILRGSSFKAGTAHTTYAKSNSSGTWQAFSIKKNKDKIPIQVGDVLIKPRHGKGSSWSSSHGDVIYKIEGNKAMASGGNVGDTAKVAKTFQLSEDGSLVNAGKYVVILKKMR